MKRWIAFVVALVFFPATAYATTRPSVSVSMDKASLEGEKVRARATVMGNGATPSFLHLLDSETDLTTQAAPAPVDLWLLLDSSASCARQKMDQRLAVWLGKLRGALHPASRVSLVTFHRGSLEVPALGVAPKALPGIRIQCSPQAVSAEVEQAMVRVLQAPVQSNLPRAVWVLSSGNLVVRPDTLQRLKDSDTQLFAFLYNPAIRGALRPTLESMRLRLGGLFFDGSALELTNALPAQWSNLEASVPFELNQAAASIAVGVRQGDTLITSAPTQLDLSKISTPGKLSILGAASLFMLSLIGAWLSFKVLRPYFARSCPLCKHRFRTQDKVCAFCFESNGAYLITDSPLGPDTLPPHRMVVPLHTREARVGTKKHSVMRLFPAHKGMRRNYFSIIQERGAFRLVPSGKATVFANSIPIVSQRYLSSGDVIEVGANRMVFVKHGRSEYAAPEVV